MKKIFLSMVINVISVMCFGQKEPEFAWEPFIFNKADSSFITSMPCESVYAKAKASASMYLTGLGKIKTYYYINGVNSALNITNDVDIIINTGGVSPQQSISIIKLETLQSKRRWKSGEAGAFTGATSNEDASITLKYKKYGNLSVLISTSSLENGEYCLAITNMMTNSKSAKVYTFSISNNINKSDISENDSSKCNYINTRTNQRCQFTVDKRGKYCTTHKYMYNHR